MSKFKKQRARLWNIDPHCENCGVPTILPEDCPGFKPNQKWPQPNNMATIQHVHNRLDPNRRQTPGEIQTTKRLHLLWCYKCNQDDNEEYIAKIPKEYLRERSQKGHDKDAIQIPYYETNTLLPS